MIQCWERSKVRQKKRTTASPVVQAANPPSQSKKNLLASAKMRFSGKRIKLGNVKHWKEKDS